MTETNETDKDTDKPKDSNDSSSSLGYLKGVCIAAIWVFLALLLVAIFWPNLTERTKFFTGNFFNLLIAFAVIAQVLIYRKQWHVMGLQWREANRQAQSSAQMIELMVLNECAYIRFGDIKPVVKGNTLIVSGKLYNGGRTPAWDLDRNFAIALGEPPPRDWVFDWRAHPTHERTNIMILAGRCRF